MNPGGTIAFAVILITMIGGFTVGTLGLIFWFISKMKGAGNQLSHEELHQLMRDVEEIRDEVRAIREQQADLTLMLHDAPTRESDDARRR
ncbi:MAG: hypothetical protein O3A46_15515 [Candidatus Poribacteria bacterium]|nr:hypothetical protein [Candidatus Poribacteria bacterium]